jgi:hypothetical protein
MPFLSTDSAGITSPLSRRPTKRNVGVFFSARGGGIKSIILRCGSSHFKLHYQTRAKRKSSLAFLYTPAQPSLAQPISTLPASPWFPLALFPSHRSFPYLHIEHTHTRLHQYSPVSPGRKLPAVQIPRRILSGCGGLGASARRVAERTACLGSAEGGSVTREEFWSLCACA